MVCVRVSTSDALGRGMRRVLTSKKFKKKNPIKTQKTRLHEGSFAVCKHSSACRDMTCDIWEGVGDIGLTTWQNSWMGQAHGTDNTRWFVSRNKGQQHEGRHCGRGPQPLGSNA